MTLYPTATCFDDVTYYIAKLMITDPSFDLDAYRIVHGICTLTNGRPYAHAWIEKDGVEAIGCAIMEGERVFYYADRRDYYRHFRPQELIRYTITDVARRENGGPWEAHLIQLCKDHMKYEETIKYERKNTETNETASAVSRTTNPLHRIHRAGR